MYLLFFSLDFHSPDVINGLKEGVTVMYHPSTYPHRPVGQVLLLWQPNTLENSCKLWIWTLPAIVNEIKEIVSEINNQKNDEERNILSFKVVPDLLRFRLVGPRSHLVITSILSSPPIKELPTQSTQDTSIPQAVAADSEGLEYLQSLPKWTEFSQTSQSRCWWVERVTPEDAHRLSELYNVNTESCDLFPNGSVLSLVSSDPRLTLPVKRGSIGCPPVQEESENKKNLETLLKELESELVKIKERGEREGEEIKEEEVHEKQEIDSVSSWPHPSMTTPTHFPFIWDESVRSDSSLSQLPDYVINEVRGKYFLKPESINLGHETSVLPLMLIKRQYPDTLRLPDSTHTHSLDYHSCPHKQVISGWDVILPSRWGMSYWISLIYRGARPLGLNELNTCCHLENLSPLFPRDYPDTVAGRDQEIQTLSECSSQYGRYPPDKRPNFGKLRISSPFLPQWEELMDSIPSIDSNEFSQPEKKIKLEEEEEKEEIVKEVERQDIEMNISTDISFHVIRQSSLIDVLEGFRSELFNSKVLSLNFTDILTLHGIDRLLSNNPRCLVTVLCEVASHGRIPSQSLISLPTSSDISSFLSADRRGFVGPCEPLAPRGLTFFEGGVIYSGVYSMNRKEMKDLNKKRKKALQRKNRLKGEGEVELTQEEKGKAHICIFLCCVESLGKVGFLKNLKAAPKFVTYMYMYMRV